jgi:aminoglycoside phosphotransferase family enzyme/predicted kinase
MTGASPESGLTSDHVYGERRCLASADAVGGIVIDEMLAPSVYPHPVTHLIKRETLISWIILTGQYAYKIKKPVRLDFIDATALSSRREMCEQEVALNRRLAPDLYLEVVAITRDDNGVRVGGSGEVIEYAVKMREFQGSQELGSLLDRREVCLPEIVDLAERLAEFHQRAPRTADRTFTCTDHLRDAVLGNLASLLSHLNAPEALAELGQLIDWTHDELHDLLPTLRLRERRGFIRECHGDLHARNIVRWKGHLVPFDCLDFEPKLRWIDVMNDVAFLVMDLASHDRSDLSCAFLNRYLEITGDYDGLRLLAFYAIYRALVRAMVDSIDSRNSTEPQAALRERMYKRVNTAVRLMNRPAPTLFIMHGPSGSGKSWLSERVMQSLDAIRIRSDVERKRLAGMQPTDRAAADSQQGMYEPAFTHRTYTRLLECAKSSLEGGFNTIVDAAFLDAANRRMFERFADDHRIPYVIVSCEADRATLMLRVQTRQTAHADPSDAGTEVLQWQLQNSDPLDAEELPRTVTVRTDASNAVADSIVALRRATGSNKPSI